MKEIAKACPKCHRMMKSAVVAVKNKRHCIGIELNADYAEMAKCRVEQEN